MIPGEIITYSGEIELNAGRTTVTLTIANTGDRPIQVGSHFHFFEVNEALHDLIGARECGSEQLAHVADAHDRPLVEPLKHPMTVAGGPA